MNRRPFADTATIRAAIFDVIDAGDRNGEPWLLLQDESEAQTELRGRFADAVVSMIEELQTSFKFLKLQDFRNSTCEKRCPVQQ